MNSQNETDETLVMLTLAGDQDAYGVLVSRCQKAVIAAAHYVTKNHFMAQDAAQDAFVSAWMKLDTLREPEKFCSWVCRIAANCARNMIARYRSYLPLEAAEGQLNPEDPSLDPAELCARKEEQSEVGKSLLTLPEKGKKDHLSSLLQRSFDPRDRRAYAGKRGDGKKTAPRRQKTAQKGALCHG